MTELSTNSGLQEQLGVFLNVKQQKLNIQKMCELAEAATEKCLKK